MEETKYYTPAPEDLRIGVICQIDDEDDGWSDITFDSKMAQWLYPFVDRLRVPYLTAEQIEAEGWARYAKNSFSRESLCLIIIGGRRVVIRNEADVLYHGYCRCINDLKMICKLLGI